MSLFPDFDWIGCVLIGIVLVACGGLGFIVYFAIKDKVSEFADAVEEEAGPEYEIPRASDYFALVEHGHVPNEDGLDVDFRVESSERIVGLDPASGKDFGAAIVVVEKAYLEWAGIMAEEHGQLKGFWNELASYMFDHLDMDGGTFQDLGVKHGLLIEAAYDPEVHGDIDTDIGDTIYVNTLQEDDSAAANDKD